VVDARRRASIEDPTMANVWEDVACEISNRHAPAGARLTGRLSPPGQDVASRRSTSFFKEVSP
jgi:hypothetical protein